MRNMVITGASRGIGKAIAARFVQEGWQVAICSLNESRINKAKEELKKINPEATVLAKAVDISRKKEVITFADEVKQAWGEINVLVNNAGVFIPGSIHEEEEDVLEGTMAVNLYGAYHLTRALLPEMKARKKGHVFNICSTASLRAYPNGGSYSISKYALLGFSRNLREEMKPYGVKVTAVCPGPTLTDSWDGFEGPHDRMMPPEDVAEMVWTACNLASQTVVEDIILRPVLGDIS